jgi:hypothetical protein
MPLPWPTDDPYLADNLDALDVRTSGLITANGKAPTVRYGKTTLTTPASSSTPSVLNIDPGMNKTLTAFLAQAWPLTSWSGFYTAGATTNGTLGSIAIWTLAQNVIINWMAVA